MKHRNKEIYELSMDEIVDITEGEPDAGQGGEDLPGPAAGGALALTRRLPALRMPRFQDEKQRRAGGNILRFLALILILTLIARGTAGATQARVNVTTYSSGEIVQQVVTGGLVQAADSNGAHGPDGLKIQQILVSPGQKVSEGTPLAEYDANDIADALARAELKLESLKTQQANLQSSSTHDNTTLTGAQRSLDWSREDYNNTVNTQNSLVAQAEAAEHTALVALENARADLAGINAAEEPEAHAAAQTAVAGAEDAYNAAVDAASQARTNRDDAIRQAARAIETAESSLQSAQISDANARQSASQQAATDRLSAEELALDIQQQEKLVAELTALQAANGQYASPYAGTVLETGAAGSDSTLLARIADDEGGYTAEGSISKSDAEKLALGADVDVETGGSFYGSKAATGKLLAMGDADADGRVPIKVQLPAGSWTHGDSLTLRVTQSRKTHSVTVPISALRADSNDYYLLVAEETSGVLGMQNTVVKVPVTVTAMDGERAAVEGAIGYDSRIITDSTKPLSEGDTVRLAQ